MTFDWTKLAGLLSIFSGFGIMYVPPVLLGTGAGTVAFATALVTAGFAALGVPIVSSIARARAAGAREAQLRASRYDGAARAAATRRARRTAAELRADGVEVDHAERAP